MLRLLQTMAATRQKGAGLTSAVPRATLNDEELVSRKPRSSKCRRVSLFAQNELNRLQYIQRIFKPCNSFPCSKQIQPIYKLAAGFNHSCLRQGGVEVLTIYFFLFFERLLLLKLLSVFLVWMEENKTGNLCISLF